MPTCLHARLLAQMELQCSFFKRWEAAEVKMYKRFPNGTGGAIEEWGVDLDLLWGWWRRAP